MNASADFTPIGLIYRPFSYPYTLSKARCKTFKRFCLHGLQLYYQARHFPHNQTEIQLNNTLVGLTTGSGRNKLDSELMANPKKDQIPKGYWLHLILSSLRQGQLKGIILVGTSTASGVYNTLLITQLLAKVNGWMLRLNEYPDGQGTAGLDELVSASKLVAAHSNWADPSIPPCSLPPSASPTTAPPSTPPAPPTTSLHPSPQPQPPTPSPRTVLLQQALAGSQAVDQLLNANPSSAAHILANAFLEGKDRELQSGMRKLMFDDEGVHRSRVLQLGLGKAQLEELKVAMRTGGQGQVEDELDTSEPDDGSHKAPPSQPLGQRQLINLNGHLSTGADHSPCSQTVPTTASATPDWSRAPIALTPTSHLPSALHLRNPSSLAGSLGLSVPAPVPTPSSAYDRSALSHRSAKPPVATPSHAAAPSKRPRAPSAAGADGGEKRGRGAPAGVAQPRMSQADKENFGIGTEQLAGVIGQAMAGRTGKTVTRRELNEAVAKGAPALAQRVGASTAKTWVDKAIQALEDCGRLVVGTKGSRGVGATWLVQ